MKGPTETAPEAVPTEHVRGATSSTFVGMGGLVQVIPIPTVCEETGTTTESVTKPSETAPKETKEAVSSEPSNPALQPTSEAETSKPPSGEAEASKSPSGEAKSDNPEAVPKAKAKSVSTRKPKRLRKKL